MLKDENNASSSSTQQRAALGVGIDLKEPAPKGFAGAEATADVDAQMAETSSKPAGGWWYAVAKGRKTGVFRTWAEAKKQVENLFSASFKKFPTKEQAEAFVNQHAAATKGQSGDLTRKTPAAWWLSVMGALWRMDAGAVGQVTRVFSLITRAGM